jgi:poly-beta-1,6-N-acetyl-D-glucosamine synthase
MFDKCPKLIYEVDGQSGWSSAVRQQLLKLNSSAMKRSFVLVTAARNEEKYIEKPLQAVCGQRVLPIKWVIVSDGSTDRTDEIVRRYQSMSPFLSLVRVDNQSRRDFASKVFALREGLKELQHLRYDYLGILDADISFPADYYERLLRKFEENPKLGIGGGVLMDSLDDGSIIDRHSSPWSVPGGIQFFRRACFEAIGGLMPLRLGEEDQIAEVKARMAGYEVQAFADITGWHYRLTGTGSRAPVKALFTNGLRDYYSGTYLPYQIIKCMKHLTHKPILLAGLCRLCGFLWAGVTRMQREIPPEVIAYLRQEQKSRLLAMVRRGRWWEQSPRTQARYAWAGRPSWPNKAPARD